MKKLNISLRQSLAALVLACAGTLAALADEPAPAALTDPGQIQTEAYINLQLGEESLDAGRLDDALAQYQTARNYYQQLAKDFPGWEPRVIQYRKTYCDNQIADIERRQAGGQPAELPELAPAPEETPVAEPVAAAPAPEPAPVPDRSAEVDYLKGRIASLEAELAENDTLQEELEALGADNDKLKRELEAVKKSQDGKAKDAEAAADKVRAELKDAETAADKLRAELADKDQQLQKLQQDLAAKKQLDQALNDMEANLGDLRAQNARLDKEIKTLDSELDEAESRSDQAEARAKDAEAKAKEAQALRQDAEDRAQQAEKNLQRARDEQADLEKKLAALKRQPVAEKAEREKPKPEEEPAKAIEKAKVEPKAEEPAKAAEPEKTAEKPQAGPKEKEVAAVSTVKASAPAKPVPAGTTPADYIRRLLQQGDNEGALATVQEARQAAPGDMNLVLIEGITLIRLQHYPEAATLLIDLAKNNPRNAEIHATLGAAMMGAGFYEEARQELLQAIKLDKNVGGEYYYNLAQLYALVEPYDLKLARRYYQQARDLGVAADKALEKALK